MAGDNKEARSELEPGRRAFLTWLGVGLSGIAATVVGIPVIGFIFAPLFANPRGVWRSVGQVSQFQVGQTVKVAFTDPSPMVWAGVTALTAAWLRESIVNASRLSR